MAEEEDCRTHRVAEGIHVQHLQLLVDFPLSLVVPTFKVWGLEESPAHTQTHTRTPQPSDTVPTCTEKRITSKMKHSPQKPVNFASQG